MEEMCRARRGWPPRLWSGPVLWYLLLAIGGLTRVWVFGWSEMHDMAQYERWATNTRQNGVSAAYEGIYFPVQYAALAVVLQLATIAKISFSAMFKLVNLCCEMGITLLLVNILRRSGKSRLWSLVYWLNPYVITSYGLGYIDAQFTVMLILSCCVIAFPSFLGQFFVAGIPFSLALFSKPQMIGICAGVVAVVGLWSLRELVALWSIRGNRGLWQGCARIISPWLFFMPSLMAFILLSYYIDPEHLARFAYSMLGTQDVMPCLTAHMPNVWYIPAHLMRESTNDAIYSVHDTVKVWGGLSARHLGMAITIVAVLGFATIAVFKRKVGARSGVLYGCIVSSYLVPFTMTGAHAHHAYVATATLALALSNRPKALPWVWIGLCALLGMNILGLYGPIGLQAIYTPAWRLLVACAAVLLHATVGALGALRIRATEPPDSPGEMIRVPGTQRMSHDAVHTANSRLRHPAPTRGHEV